MKYLITIYNENQILFDGKIIDLPIKKDMLIKKSIEMYQDDDPCIIHQTYVTETFIHELVQAFKDRLDQKVLLTEDMKAIEFIDIKDIEQCEIILRRK